MCTARPHHSRTARARSRPRTAFRTATGTASDAPRTGLTGRDFLLLLAATAAVFGNSAPLLTVVPLWAEHGGGGHGGAGATTALTMATTVAAQLAMGRILRRIPARQALRAGALTMGLPAFAHALSPALPLTLAVCAVRGIGFGMVTVAGSALVAELVRPAQRGRAVGWYGVAVGLPAVALLPLAVWCATEFGFVPVFLVTAILGVLAAPLSAAIGHRALAPPAGRDTAVERDAVMGRDVPVESGTGPGTGTGGPGTGIGGRGTGIERDAAERPGLGVLAVPWLLLFVSVCALGSLMSFLPLALTSPGAAPAALLTVSTALIAGRWAAGEWSDRRGAAGRLAAPAASACALGTAAFAAAGTFPAGGALPAGIVAGLVFGLGIGVLQNDTLVAMFHRAGPAHHGTVSAAWNIGYDAGFGAGALLTGALAQAFALTLPASVLVLATAVAALLLATLLATTVRVRRPTTRAGAAPREASVAVQETAHEACATPCRPRGPSPGPRGTSSEPHDLSQGARGASSEARGPSHEACGPSHEG